RGPASDVSADAGSSACRSLLAWPKQSPCWSDGPAVLLTAMRLIAVGDDHDAPRVRIDGRAEWPRIQGALVTGVPAPIPVGIRLNAAIHRPHGIEDLPSIILSIDDTVAIEVGLGAGASVFTGPPRRGAGGFPCRRAAREQLVRATVRRLQARKGQTVPQSGARKTPR